MHNEKEKEKINYSFLAKGKSICACCIYHDQKTAPTWSRIHRMQGDRRVKGETKKEIGVCPSSVCRRGGIDANGCQRRLESFIYDL